MPEVNLIEKRRAELVVSEAEKLFNAIINAAITMTPSSKYELNIVWHARAQVIDSMIFTKVVDTFREMNTNLTITRGCADTVQMTLTPEVVPSEEKVLTLFWSRAPGKFVNKFNGQEVKLDWEDKDGKHNTDPPIFTGTVREWDETLVETIIDASNKLHQEVGEVPRALYVSPAVHCILEASMLYKPTYHYEGDGKVDDGHEGTLSNRFKVYKDVTVPINLIRLIAVKDNKRMVAEVKVLDINII